MADLVDALRTRVMPALMTALGVMLLTAGLLSYTAPVTAGPGPRPTAPPSAPAVDPTPSPLITLPPIASAPPSATPTGSAIPQGVASRVRIAALDIDLPVIMGPPGYPKCDVAMYLKELRQPGQGGATYLYAHAREGMFLPLLRTKAGDQRGLVVEVWTSDALRYLYEIVEVRRDQRTLDDALAAAREELWLQTSEGPNASFGKTQVIALPISVDPATPEESMPKARPVDCG
ncbi:MAG: hypothetical protein ACLGIJ_07840 [Candidatus Limnocylindria bacterium]